MEWQEWSAVADDPSVWKNREEKGLLKADYVGDYVLRLWFEYDEQVIDMAPECVRFFCERYGNALKVSARDKAARAA
jgi:hypothetical protein